jgi:hypothetical protein
MSATKVLPPGDYAVRLLVVGGADVDGNILFSRWAIPATPALLLERIVAGSWLAVGLEYKPGRIGGCVLAEQLGPVGADIPRQAFGESVERLVPPVVETMATRMLEYIGIEPIDYHEPAERPAQLRRPAMALPVHVIDAIRDICHLVADNPSLRQGAFKARAIELGTKIDRSIEAKEDLQLTGAEVALVVDLAEAVALATVNGMNLNASTLVMNACERVIVPITDALGYSDEPLHAQGACPGHVASKADPKVCGRCGIHIDDLRPPESDGFNKSGETNVG